MSHRAQGTMRLRSLVAVLAVAGAAAGGYLFRHQIGDLLGLSGGEPVAGPSGSPSPSVPTSPTPTQEPTTRIVIHGTGDVSIDPSYIATYGSHGYGYAWSGLDGLFKKDDLTVINCENPVSDLGAPVRKEITFRGSPDALPAMRRAGVEVANLGNNHAYDQGPEALIDTVKNLKRNHIAPVGAGKDQKHALKPARFHEGGWDIAVLGFDLVVDPYPEAVATPDHPGTAAGHDTDLMVRTVRRVSNRADITIVTIHWGVELDTAPRADQVDLGHRFVDAGADMIFGHHAHRLQQMDRYRGRPIFWGLGNFVWPAFSSAGATTAVAQAVVTPTGKVRGKLLPAYIEDAGHPVLRKD